MRGYGGEYTNKILGKTSQSNYYHDERGPWSEDLPFLNYNQGKLIGDCDDDIITRAEIAKGMFDTSLKVREDSQIVIFADQIKNSDCDTYTNTFSYPFGFATWDKR